MKNQLFILLTIMLSGCKGGYEITELYEQKILNSEKTIVEYQAWSTLNDGSKYGWTLKSPAEAINIVDAKQMPFRFLTAIPSRDTIFSVELIEGGSRIPEFASSKTAEFNGTVIRTDYYKYSIGGCMNLTYRFSHYQERNDSLILKGIEVEHYPLPMKGKEIGLMKGNVKLVESKVESGILESIEISAFVLPRYVGGLVDNVTILRDDSMRTNGQVAFKFTPKSPMKVDDFSDVGTYKKREIENVHNL